MSSVLFPSSSNAFFEGPNGILFGEFCWESTAGRKFDGGPESAVGVVETIATEHHNGMFNVHKTFLQ
jgi:hypothetical protein